MGTVGDNVSILALPGPHDIATDDNLAAGWGFAAIRGGKAALASTKIQHKTGSTPGTNQAVYQRCVSVGARGYAQSPLHSG
jgi:hypothetical protein